MISRAYAIAACVFGWTMASAQAGPAVKPSPATPVEVVNGANHPVPVTVTNPPKPQAQSPAMFRATADGAVEVTVVPAPATGTVFVVQSVDMLVASNVNQALTTASCSFRFVSPAAGGGTVSVSLASFGLEPTNTRRDVWAAHQSVYWVLKEGESITANCLSQPANVFIQFAAGGYSVPAN